MSNKILELIYPNVCGICGKICKESLCKRCAIEIKKYEINLVNKNKKMYFNESMHIFKYNEMIRQRLIEYKFQDKSYMYKTFAKIILKNKKVCGFLEKYDIMIPVPIHKKRRLKRGYNQTELIAKEICKNISLELKTDVLIKQKNIKAQSELNKNERKQNIKNAFEIKNINEIIDKKILLFDDIYTTGSTVNECSKILKKAGAKQIGVVTIAKD